ncbi:MAG TPA: flagellar motor protein MotB [Candidatus Avamphibacillus intestinigallinarum]|nr:flagellar motor protein MotB [Candidatus Avamphibacillus intestinigallinarum]
MARRKNKREDEGMDESWLLPYADILTLLLALFIVLYSMSSVDAKKFEELSQVFNSVFVGDKGVVDNGEAIPPQDPSKEITAEDKKEDKEDKKAQKEAQDEKKAEELYSEKEQNELKKVQKRVDGYIEQNDLSEKFETSLSEEGLLITIRDTVLFDSGSASVRNTDESTAKELSDLLYMKPQREVIISGHTDNMPIRNSKYDSNWELSVSRAVNFMKLILKNDKLDPKSFSAKGFGEYQPSATNDTKEGRAKNRRVEIQIIANTKETESE